MLIKYKEDINSIEFNLIKDKIYDVYALLIELSTQDIKYIIYDGNYIRFVKEKDIIILDEKFLRGYYIHEEETVLIGEYKGFNYNHYYNLLDGYSEFDEKVAKEIFLKEKKSLEKIFKKRRIELAILNNIIKGENVSGKNDTISSYYYYENKIEIFYQMEQDKVITIDILSEEMNLEKIKGLIF